MINMMNKMETTAPRQDVHCARRNNRVSRSGGRGSCRAESAMNRGLTPSG